MKLCFGLLLYSYAKIIILIQLNFTKISMNYLTLGKVLGSIVGKIKTNKMQEVLFKDVIY